MSTSGRFGSVRLALCTLRRNRGFATIAVLSLSVAIALNATISGLIDGMVDPQIDVRQPEQLHYLGLGSTFTLWLPLSEDSGRRLIRETH